MKLSYNWLKEYFNDELPSPEKLGEILSLHAYEVESIEEETGGDYILDVDVLPNRSHDSLSYWGIAREIALLFDKKAKLPDKMYETDESQKSEDFISLRVEDNKLVPRAMKRVVLDVRVGGSPEWLKKKIEAQGGKTKNNIVDITNLVMWETGQPVHAFDLDKIKNGEIEIRGAKKGEKIKTLDGTDYELEEGILVIADPEKPLDIAGLKGGIDSGITKETKRIVLSICNFNQAKIRNASQTLNLRTDASTRFGNGISPHMTQIAMERLSFLVREIAEGKILDDILDVYPQEKVRTTGEYKIGLSLDEVNKVLGTSLDETEVEGILKRMVQHQGFDFKKIVSPREKIIEVAKSLVGVPYKYGASITYDAPRFFDCSSFVAYCFVQGGFSLPRMTADQYLFGKEISMDDLEPGDIIFSKNTFSDTEEIERLGIKQKTIHKETKDFFSGTEIPELSHAGIYLGDEKVIHASPKWDKEEVIIQNLKEAPAFKNIVGARRIIEKPARLKDVSRSGGDDDRYMVSVPLSRLDLRAGPGFMISGNKEDIIEEIGRIYGFYKLESKEPALFYFEPKINKKFYYIEKIKDLLVGEGFSEVMTYSFRDEGQVKLHNALATDKEYLRESLEEGLRESFELNTKNSPLFLSEDIKIFEIGTVFDKENEKIELGIISTKEKDSLACLMKIRNEFGVKVTPKQKENGVFVNLSEYIEKLPDPNSYQDLKEKISSENKFQGISAYPFALRDIAFWVSKDVSVEKAEEVIREEGTELLKRIKLFDLYEKDDRKSYAFNLVFQSNEKTLSDDEVNKIMDRIYERVAKEGWEAR